MPNDKKRKRELVVDPKYLPETNLNSYVAQFSTCLDECSCKKKYYKNNNLYDDFQETNIYKRGNCYIFTGINTYKYLEDCGLHYYPTLFYNFITDFVKHKITTDNVIVDLRPPFFCLMRQDDDDEKSKLSLTVTKVKEEIPDDLVNHLEISEVYNDRICKHHESEEYEDEDYLKDGTFVTSELLFDRPNNGDSGKSIRFIYGQRHLELFVENIEEVIVKNVT